MNRKPVSRAIGSIAIAVGLVTAGVANGQPANAWPWSATVYVKGTAGCTNTGGLQTVHAEGSLDKQRFTWDSGLSNWNGKAPTYQIKFTNVRSGRVPNGGGWAWITVKCSAGGYHQSWREMYRPSAGDTLTLNF